MKLSAALFAALALATPNCFGAEAIFDMAVKNLIDSYNRSSDSVWIHVSEPPEQIIKGAGLQYASYIEQLRAADPASLSAKIAEESTADFHEIVVLNSAERSLYRVIWLYVWESPGCGDYYFVADTFLVGDSGERSTERVSPSIRRRGPTVCAN